MVVDYRGARSSAELEVSLAMANNLGISVTWKSVKDYDGKEVQKLVGINNASIRVNFYTSAKMTGDIILQNPIDAKADSIKPQVTEALK
jgi:hypothetical protein